MLRRHMLNIRATPVVIRSSRIRPNHGTTRALILAGARSMTMTWVWTGVALWLGLNAAVVLRLAYIVRAAETPRPVHRALLRRI
jgi:hypothetical protein